MRPRTFSLPPPKPPPPLSKPANTRPPAVRVGAEQRQRLDDRFGAPLAEGEVVFAAAAIVGVALDRDLHLAVRGQRLGVGLDQER